MSIYVPDRLPKHWPLNFYPGTVSYTHLDVYKRQVKPCPAVYNKGCLGQNILVHLVQRVPELGHTYPVQVKHQGIEIPGIFAAPPPSKIGDRGHNREIGVLQLPQLIQLISNGTPLSLIHI